MQPNHIRPIPKRLEKRILDYDAKHSDYRGVRFYAYLTTIRKELVKSPLPSVTKASILVFSNKSPFTAYIRTIVL